jgi:hypothetical protein
MIRSRLVLLALCALLAVAAGAAPVAVYYLGANGKWQTLPCRYDSKQGVIIFSLDPAQTKGGRTLILQGLPPGVVLDDNTAPALSQIKLDGRPLPHVTAANLDLDWLPAHPREIVFSLADSQNLLDGKSLRVLVNGVPLEGRQLQVRYGAASHKSAQLVCRVGDLLEKQGKFANVIEMRASDLSPLHNTTTRVLSYHVLGAITENPQVLVDSIYPHYENIQCLVDGKVNPPGETTVGSTWASQDTPGDHWVVLAWPQPQTLNRVEVCWANYQGIFWASNKLLVQTWDGQKWVTASTLDKITPEASTVIPLGGVKTTRLRLVQPDGQGRPSKGPNEFWLSEIRTN